MLEPQAQKAYHHGDLHEQLLNAGEQALSDMPVEKVSLREIARRAGVSHAAPKHHFPSLGHLLGEIAARGYWRFIAALADGADAAQDQAPMQRLAAMGRAYLRFAEQNPAAYQLMFGQREPMVMTPNLIKASYAAWAQLVEAVTAIVGPPRAQAAALHVWSAVHGLSLLKQAGRVPPDLPWHQAEEQMLKMMLSGLDSE
jgi:AcrR family transcriptional regulator